MLYCMVLTQAMFAQCWLYDDPATEDKWCSENRGRALIFIGPLLLFVAAGTCGLIVAPPSPRASHFAMPSSLLSCALRPHIAP